MVTRQKLAVGRIFGLTLAIVGISLSIHYYRISSRIEAETQQRIETHPMETAIDLSRPGKATTPYRQTYKSQHKTLLFLKCEPSLETKEAPEEFFKDLAANVVIRNSDGAEIISVDIHSKTVSNWDDRI